MSDTDAQDDVLDYDRIKAAGISLHANGVHHLPTGEWTASRPSGSASVAFGYDGEDVEGQAWWTGTTYTDGEPADTFSYTTVTQLLDHVARVVAR